MKSKRPETLMTPEEVGPIMGISPAMVRNGILTGAFPWGSAVPNGTGHSYIIVRKRFLAWWNALDLILDGREVNLYEKKGT